MKYVPEMQTFYERLERTPLSVYAIALWHALMHMNHKQEWSKQFQAVSAALCFKSGLKEDKLEQARQELVRQGLLHYEEVEDGQAATYILCPLADASEGDEENRSITVQNTETDDGQSTDERSITDHHVNNHHVDYRPVDGECTIKAHLKKLDIHDKMLKNEWQQSVNMALTDIGVSDETIRGLQKYHPGDPVNIIIQPGQPSPKERFKEAPKKPAKSKVNPSTKRAGKPHHSHRLIREGSKNQMIFKMAKNE